MRPRSDLLLLFTLLGAAAGCSSDDTTAGPHGTGADATTPARVAMPGCEAGNGFDDLRYSPTLKRIIVPGNYTGNIYLVEPDTLEVTTIGGFSSEPTWNGGDTQGPATVDEGGGWIFVGDRTKHTLNIVDPAQKKIVASLALADYPDYLRYVESTSEVWVTEPYVGQVEVVSVSNGNPPALASVATFQVGGVPEGLGVDATRNLIFSQGLLDGALYVMGATERQKTGSWVTGCPQTHGNAAVDAERGFVFVGCLAKAKVAVLDIAQAGAHLDEYELGPGAFLPAYSSTLRHLYVRGDPGMPIAILGVESTGKLTQLETIDSIEKAHCLTADDRKHFWTCDWAGGALIRFSDSHPATAR